MVEPSPTLSGKDLHSLKGEEQKEALKEELVLRRKKLRQELPDYDMFRVRDAQEAAEYVDEIFDNMKELEEHFRPGEQPHVTAKERAQLIDFIEELHAIFDLIPETLFISIQTVDRFLSCPAGDSVEDLQRIAVAAVLIVSKYEDIIPPSLDEMIKQMKKPCT